MFIIKKSLENSWIVKDSSPFNIQWKNNKPIFIDTASFVPCGEVLEWKGYNQFVCMFLNPLLIKAHLNLNFNSILRSNIDGINTEDALKFFQFLNKFKKGVFSHIYFQKLSKSL